MSAQTTRPVVIVTGGTGGIGTAIAAALLAAGNAVVLTGRSTEQGAAVVEQLGEYAAFVAADHSLGETPGAVMDAVAGLGERFGELHGLVNNVGRRHNDVIGEHTAERLAETLALNVTSAILMTQAVVPAMPAGGSIVNVSSRLAVAGMPGVSGYAASKAALNGFTVASSIELAPKRIRVNAVAPGMTKTPLIEAWLAEQPDPAAAEADQAGKVPLGKLCSPEDVGAAVAFLVSPAAAYLTGTILPVDGGYTAA
ncbi:SDR family oxidoreductase [uncultured Agrococcus sp.]|uniref:SDR family NAD(P)-dependent oxidoreductase n=1 Tax=uncultured Agrococcus sp. TaxID=382258 RepID=UPI0025E50667|nr:SDR family oxidoreductase [uncultured Agrococcus sp.]